ncbi:MAG: PfkB family carbohydrate kinase, partial [Fimbriimonadaceae bacterium]|nr:PfkB family carbohydrate kinase [Fimbriimonadaceae bacterium]
HEAEETSGIRVDPGRPDSAAAVHAWFQARGVPSTIVTLGSAGCWVPGVGHLPAIPVQAVDAVGAGDCFAGVLAAGLARGESLAESARRAQAAAALSVTRPGAQAAMPTAAEIEAFLTEL